MPELSVAILGLGRIGASIGLSLKRYQDDVGRYTFNITGYDPRPKYDEEAQKQKAVDRTANRAYQAVNGADIVVVAMPYEDLQRTYQDVGGGARDGVVILDTSVMKQPSLNWAKQYLSEEKHLIGITPIVNPAYLYQSGDDQAMAAADLFDKGSMLLTPAPDCAKEAVDLAVNFSTILGATPRFFDPAEHDILTTYTEQLPDIMGTALFYTLMKRSGWNDTQRLTNPAFAVLTRALYDKHPDGLRDEWLHNREMLVQSMDALLSTLQTFRDLLAENEHDAIEAAVVEAAEEYEGWINRRNQGSYDEKPAGGNVSSPSIMGGLLGENLARRLTGKKDD